MPQYTTAQIAERVGGRLQGPPDRSITGVAELRLASPTDLSFLGGPQHLPAYRDSQAGAVLVSQGIEAEPQTPTGSDNGSDPACVITVDSADLAMGKALELFAPPPVHTEPGIHPTAIVHPTAQIGQNPSIGPYAYLGPNATLGDHCTLHAHTAVYDHATLGDRCTLWAHAVVRERCTLGKHCTLHSGAVIGTDGFGYRPDQDDQGRFCFAKIPQIGTVEIGDDCEIGANTTIDRAKFAATVLGQGCKLDNLIQIGHNCILGNHVVIAACTAIGGSCTIGDATVIGGAANIADHLHIGSRVRLAGGAGLMHSVPDGETWAGSPASNAKTTFRELAALRRLPSLIKSLKPLLREPPASS